MAYFKETRRIHLAFNDNDYERRPYLREVYSKNYSGWFTKIYTNEKLDENWKMRIFRIEWDKYEEDIKNQEISY